MYELEKALQIASFASKFGVEGEQVVYKCYRTTAKYEVVSLTYWRQMDDVDDDIDLYACVKDGVVTINEKKAVIAKEGGVFVLRINGSTIDRSYGTGYLRQLAWDADVPDENISFPDGLE